MNRRRIALLLTVVLAAAILTVEPALAQCPMCKAAIESSAEGQSVARGLNLAILVLLIPPVAIFTGLFALFYRYRSVQGKSKG